MDTAGCQREANFVMSTSPSSRPFDTKARDGELGRSLLLRMELQSDPTFLCVVRGAVERLTELFGFTPEECRAITLAIDEALTNIIRHAYNSRPDKPIELYFRSVRRAADEAPGAGLEILIYDHGPAIEHHKLCGRSLDDVKPGGLGLHFIQQIMDIVEYQRTNETNCLRLVKFVRAANQEQEQEQKP